MWKAFTCDLKYTTDWSWFFYPIDNKRLIMLSIDSNNVCPKPLFLEMISYRLLK